MADPQLCTCCALQASMRCSACYAVGIVVPFCSVEHQKLIWRTHKAICGRVLTEPYIPPLAELEFLAFSLTSDDYDSSLRRIETWVPIEERPLRVAGNSVSTADDLPPVYRDAFRRQWIMFQRSPAIHVDPAHGRTHTAIALRAATWIPLFDSTPPLADYIFGPTIPPSAMPYTLLDHSLFHLYRQEMVSQETNIIAYVNSLVVYATFASQYILDPTDSPFEHLVQLEMLGKRAKVEGLKVKERGTLVRYSDYPSESHPQYQMKGDLVYWSFVHFLAMRRVVEKKGQAFPKLR